MTGSPNNTKFPFAPRKDGQPVPPHPSAPTPAPEDLSHFDEKTVLRPNTPAPSDTGEDTAKEASRLAVGDSQAIPAPGEPPNLTAVPGTDELKKIGPYIVHRELARGGMGAVFLAEDMDLKRQVAIKVMSRELTDDREALQRFKREARATASIQHVNVANIYLVGETDDEPFLAMEFISAGSLEDRIRRRERFPISKAADAMMQASEALKEAKKNGIIHRDIKPGNIMLNEKGVVKLVDFGLAKFFNEDSFRTMAGTIMGTPRYMSPEQAQGREVDFRSDIYALGATFYHILSGKPPFEGDSPAQVMMKHLTSPLVPMRSINPEVPMEFDDVIRKCMSKDPLERYQDYTDLISDLSAIKLQWTARERGGSIVDSIHGLPTVITGPDGNPLPPGAGAQGSRGSASSASVSGYGASSGSLTMEFEEGEKKSSGLQTAILAGTGGLVVLVLLLVVILPGGGDEQTPAAAAGASGEGPSRLAMLLDRAASGSQTNTSVPADPDFLAWRDTQDILRSYSIALLAFEGNLGRRPESLSELVDEGFTTTDPRDGWGRSLDYRSFRNEIVSPGLDARLNTNDDLVVDLDGNVTTNNEAPYQRLAENEEERRQRVLDQ